MGVWYTRDMKTTVEIDDDLLKTAKKLAIDEGISLRQLLESALRARLTSTPSKEMYGGFASRGELYDDATSSILDDIRAAARRVRERAAASGSGSVRD